MAEGVWRCTMKGAEDAVLGMSFSLGQVVASMTVRVKYLKQKQP